MGKIIMNRNIQHYMVCFCVAFALSGIFVGCASAVFYPEGYMGTVIGKDIGDNTFEVETTHKWAYTEWQSSSATTKWTFPNNDAADEVDVGDYVEILGFPEISGWVIGLGKMESSTEKIITDLYGDPDFLEPYFQKPPDPPLSGDYTLEYNSKPNCSDCSECNCLADYTNVTIVNRTGHTEVDSHRLYPGQNYTYSGAEHRISITFHSGEAPAYPECTDRPGVGPQPISDFTVHIIRVPSAARGDLNHDGNITGADVVIVLGIAVRGEYVPGADMDENGYVNALDARMVLSMLTTRDLC